MKSFARINRAWVLRRVARPLKERGRGRALAKFGAILSVLTFLLLLPAREGQAQPTVIATIPVGTTPVGVGVDPTTNRIYVYKGDPSRGEPFGLVVVDGSTVPGTVVTTIPVGAGTFGSGSVGVNATTHRVYVVGSGTSAVSVVDVAVGSPTENTIVATVPVSAQPAGIGVNPVTDRVYAALPSLDVVAVIGEDADHDGFSPPQDCNDNDPNVHPGATELCNGVDDNCNGTVDEGFDVAASCTVGTGACQKTGTKVCTANGQGTECNVTPGTPGTEVCNGIDDDCDGAVDESPTDPLQPLTQSCYSGPSGTAGVGICHAGTQTCSSGTFGACVGEVTPSAEICGDGIDQNCDGQDFKCPLSQGFWKNNPNAWPVSSLTLGSQSYTKAELLTILNTPVGSGKNADASLILADQLIAARLNIANGSDPAPVSATIADADSLLSGFAGKLPYHVKPSSVTGQAMVNDASMLESYNKG